MNSFSLEHNFHKSFRSHLRNNINRTFYFVSVDKRFLVKSLSDTEKRKLFSILDDMIDYFNKQQNLSFIQRIYGVFEVKTNIFGNLNIMIT